MPCYDSRSSGATQDNTSFYEMVKRNNELVRLLCEAGKLIRAYQADPNTYRKESDELREWITNHIEWDNYRRKNHE